MAAISIQDDYVSFKAVLNHLKQLHAFAQTGLFKLETIEGHKAYFGLIKGEIVAVRYRKIKRGVRAINEIKKIRSAQYSFDSTAEVIPDPPTALLKDALEEMFQLIADELPIK